MDKVKKYIFQSYISFFFEIEDKSKIQFSKKICKKWFNNKSEFDKILVERYGKTLLFHSFFKRLSLRNTCRNEFITREIILEKTESLEIKFKELLIYPFQFANKISREIYIDLFEQDYIKLFIVTASFNNENNIEKYINSINIQNYPLYRICYVDDSSTDKTISLCKEYKESIFKNKMNILVNGSTKKQAYSKYRSYSLADDDEVLVFVDGDDWLFHKNVFHFISYLYMKYPSNKITCGSFMTIFEKKEIIQKNTTTDKTNIEYTVVPLNYNCRQDKIWKYSHLRTGYSYLFKNIPNEHLQNKNGDWLESCTDVAEMYWALQQCKQYIYIHNVLLCYNKDNSILYSNSSYQESYNKIRQDTLLYIKSLSPPIPVDSIYIIHLNRHIQKKEKLELKIKKYVKQNYEYFNAVDGFSIEFNKHFIQYKKVYHDKCRLNKGSLGLLATYYSLLQEAIQLNKNRILIMEDDVIFHTEFNSKIKSIKDKSILDKYDIIYLGANQQEWEHVKFSKAYDGYTTNPGIFKWTYGTFSIILNKKVIHALYEYLKAKQIWEHNWPIDCIINFLCDRNKFSVFVCFPNLVIADLSTSDIQKKRDMKEWSKKLRWTLENYDYIEGESLEQCNDKCLIFQ